MEHIWTMVMLKICKHTFYAYLSRIWKLMQFTRFVRKVIATKILLSGKFSFFLTLDPPTLCQTWEKKCPKPSWQAFKPPPPLTGNAHIWNQHIMTRIGYLFIIAWALVSWQYLDRVPAWLYPMLVSWQYPIPSLPQLPHFPHFLLLSLLCHHHHIHHHRHNIHHCHLLHQDGWVPN